MKRKIVKTRLVRLLSKDMEGEIMKHLAALQAEFPALEWDFNIYGVQFNLFAAFKGFGQAE